MTWSKRIFALRYGVRCCRMHPFTVFPPAQARACRVMLETLDSILQNHPIRPDLGRPRLPVDRIFSMSGFGTVVTGTLSDGSLSVGDAVEILPSGLTGRIRGLQAHNQKEETALPGSRTAINITGLDLTQVHRGEVVTHPGQYRPSQRMDVHFRLLPDASASSPPSHRGQGIHRHLGNSRGCSLAGHGDSLPRGTGLAAA